MKRAGREEGISHPKNFQAILRSSWATVRVWRPHQLFSFSRWGNGGLESEGTCAGLSGWSRGLGPVQVPSLPVTMSESLLSGPLISHL